MKPIYFHKTITKNKSFELQSGFWEDFQHWFSFSFKWSTNKVDHWGPAIDLQVLNFYFIMFIYDSRHSEESEIIIEE